MNSRDIVSKLVEGDGQPGYDLPPEGSTSCHSVMLLILSISIKILLRSACHCCSGEPDWWLNMSEIERAIRRSG